MALTGRAFSLGALLLLVLSLGIACGGKEAGLSPTATPPRSLASPTPPPPNTVLIQNGQFIPKRLTIKLGETVTWINTDNAAYSLRDGLYGADFFISGFQPGEQRSFTFMKTGEFEIGDFRYSDLRGTIIVTD
ncbi:MAG: hypothetical protein HYU29_07865 [Chloroflexi bacterium]|nr:hypothetical protein [Chloroflexota bacterium]